MSLPIRTAGSPCGAVPVHLSFPSCAYPGHNPGRGPPVLGVVVPSRACRQLAVLAHAQVGLVPHRVQDVRYHEPGPSLGARLSHVLLPLAFVERTESRTPLSRYTMPTSFWRLARHSLIPSTGSLLTTASPTPYVERGMVAEALGPLARA